MTQHHQHDHSVPGVGGAPESSADGQQGLRLHAVIATIATIATVLSAGATAVFVGLGSWPLAAVLAVVTLASLAALGWALRHRRRGQRLRDEHGADRAHG